MTPFFKISDKWPVQEMANEKTPKQNKTNQVLKYYTP